LSAFKENKYFGQEKQRNFITTICQKQKPNYHTPIPEDLMLTGKRIYAPE